MVTLGFLGAGNMAEAIARAALDHDVLSPNEVLACDLSPERREAFAALGVGVTDDPAELVRQSESVLLAVKPQQMQAPAATLGEHARPEAVVISIMAGVTSQKLAAAMGRGGGGEGGGARIVRVMPNTPMLVGRGMAAVARGAGAKEGDEALAMRLFSAGQSQAIRVDEADLDAVTAVSGSGPAYLFYLAEAMERAAAELGLGQHGPTLVRQTLLGAAEMLLHGDPAPDPAELRRRVTSPGGTTEAAIGHLEGNKSRDVIVNALKAACDRSRELGA